MGPSFHIRTARGEDLETLTQLEALCFANPWPASSLATEVARPESEWLLALGPRPLGYACFLAVAGEAELLRLGVAPAMRRSGVGRALMSEGLARLKQRGDSRCHLEVAARNEGAIALYESLGFALVGCRRRYYPDGDDAMLYLWRAA